MSDSTYTVSTPPDLSSLGREKDHIYYTESESMLDEIETMSNCGKYKKTLTSKSFNSTGDVLLPNLDGIEQVFLYLQLPPTPVHYLLCEGWAYHILTALNLQLGSSNLSLQEKRSHTNLSELWWSVCTREKRDAIIRLGGSLATNAVQTLTNDAVICLNLPFSSMKANIAKRSLDASLLSSPILIQCSFGPADSIYGLSVTAPDGAATLNPSGFNIADIIVRQDVLSDKKMSLKDTLMRTDLFSVYPYCHTLSGTTRTFNATVGIATVNGSKASAVIELNGFLNSDLLAISWILNKTRDLKSEAAPMKANHRPCNPGRFLECQNIQLFYNGSTFFDLPNRSHDMLALSLVEGDIKATGSYNDTAGASKASVGHQYILNFTSKLRTQFLSRLSNVPRFSQQPLELRFDFLDPYPIAPATLMAPAQANYTFRSSYHYNAVAMFSKGNSNIFFT